MKKSTKDKLKRQREKQRAIRKRQIVNVISSEQMNELKNFNMETFTDAEINKERMLSCLQLLFEIVINSNYFDEVVRMAKQNISDTWFDKEVNDEWVKEILLKEMESARNSSLESIALKICFWGNRIAHHLDNELSAGKPKHKLNELYVKYYLNPDYHYDIADSMNIENLESTSTVAVKLREILVNEKDALGDIDTVEKLNNLFCGINIRNELWTLKQQMIKAILLSISREERSTVKVTTLDEKKDVSINGSETQRLIIREINGIAPVIIHCDKEKVDEFLKQNGIRPIEIETSDEIIEFAKKGKVGIHFILDEEDMEIFKYEASEKTAAERLNKVMYRGEEWDER